LTTNNEFLGCFPFGKDLLLGVSIDVHFFKRAIPNIVYHPLSDIHKDEIKTRITQYNKFDTKVPIFAILEEAQNADHITFHKLRK
jgi:RecJ-like exonuclease